MSGAKYSVWIGGVEATDYLVTEEKAEAIKEELEMEDGYTDVAIIRYEEGEYQWSTH